MKAEYKRDLQNNYLILEAPQDADANDYRLRMAEQNRIPGLLPFHSARRDGMLYLHYEITSLQPLAGMFEKRTMTYGDILLLMTEIREVLEVLQKYLLDPAQLLFAPEYLFADPDHHKVYFCYFPGSGEDMSITALAEFILKRLDHREQQAVTLGYGFYQKAAEENFSLRQTLKEMLAEEGYPAGINGGGVSVRHPESAGGAFAQRGAGTDSVLSSRRESAEGLTVQRPEHSGGLEVRLREDLQSPKLQRRENTEGLTVRRREGVDGGRPVPAAVKDSGRSAAEHGVSPEIRASYEVKHRERKGRADRKVDRLFQLVHPAVLLSALFLLATLEIAFYLEMLTLTEAGGIFFLLISVEVLVNKFWRASKEKKKENRWVEEDDEMYRMLQEEMYEMPRREPVIEETRCLTQEPEQSGLCLVCIHAGSSGSLGPDIFVGSSPVYVGKIQGESDVILNSPTVSRRHARLECMDGVCYVKDLNSRNGTFCNGRRLQPQEQCQIAQGDEISFAEVGYRVVAR